jgi:hypothetical protein
VLELGVYGENEEGKVTYLAGSFAPSTVLLCALLGDTLCFSGERTLCTPAGPHVFGGSPFVPTTFEWFDYYIEGPLIASHHFFFKKKSATLDSAT